MFTSRYFMKNILQIKLKYITFMFVCAIVLYMGFVILISLSFHPKEIPVLLWWTQFSIDDERVINCYEKYECLVTNNRNHNINNTPGAYLFYGSHLRHHDVPLPRNKSLWAIFHEESPKNLASFLHDETINLFNITSTFSRHSDLPLTLQYLPSIQHITGREYYVSLEEKNALLDNLSPVLYLQSDCDTPIQRDQYVKELMQYVKIDSYGDCLKNKQFPPELSKIYPLDYYNKEVISFNAKYKFTLAIENAICHDYITEKLWRPLMAGSIPIYLGSPSVEDWLPNNNSAILIKNYKNMKELAEYINKVNQNNSLYEIFMEHKIYQRIDNDLLKDTLDGNIHASDGYEDESTTIPSFECFVCKFIHEKRQPVIRTDGKSVYNCPPPIGEKNSWSSYWELGKCQSKAFKILVEQGRNYTQGKFEKLWKTLYENNDC